ncbi:hypothetical protein GCM10025298_15070 [Natronobiforma cellulositropha]
MSEEVPGEDEREGEDERDHEVLEKRRDALGEWLRFHRWRLRCESVGPTTGATVATWLERAIDGRSGESDRTDADHCTGESDEEATSGHLSS